ncbi:MAG: Holliday junction resolvase RuvX [Planctomycetes bacterium]|nr:Holliday junction resolvase RuvX [Planctomycetota bacterium]
MRILGIDYGTKRVGVAITNDKETLALPHSVIETEDSAEKLSAIGDIARSENIGKIVIGIPYKYDGSLGERAKTVLAFAESLRKELSLPVETYDERLSSVESEERLREIKMSRQDKRKRINAVAAQLILQGYLDSKKPVG